MDCDSFPGMSLISGLVYIVGLYGVLFIFYIGWISDGRKHGGVGVPDSANRMVINTNKYCV